MEGLQRRSRLTKKREMPPAAIQLLDGPDCNLQKTELGRGTSARKRRYPTNMRHIRWMLSSKVD